MCLKQTSIYFNRCKYNPERLACNDKVDSVEEAEECENNTVT